MISELNFFAKSVTNSPATTNVSLLASAILFPLLIASIVGAKPENPTTAPSRISYSDCDAASHNAFFPERIWQFSFKLFLNSAALFSSTTTTASG